MTCNAGQRRPGVSECNTHAMRTVEERRRWVAEHTVLAAVVIGLAWGIATGVTMAALHGFHRAMFDLVVLPVAGLFLFGPFFSLMIRRKVRRDDARRMS